MKMKQISETTLKITVSMNDLEERGMELSDFLLPQEKTEDFFYSLLEEVDLPEQFKLSGLLSFRVTPKQDRVDIFVTKSDVDTNMNLAELGNTADFSPEDFFKQMADHFNDHSDTEALKRLEEAERLEELNEEEESKEDSEEFPDYVHYVLGFRDFSQVVNFAKSVNYPVEAAEIYKYRDAYQMTVLLYVENQPLGYADTIYSRMLEHAQASTVTRAYLREHALLLREGDVLKELAGV